MRSNQKNNIRFCCFCAGRLKPPPDKRKIRKKRKSTSSNAENSSGEPVLYGQSGHAKWTEGGITLAASDYKRPERNVVLEPFVKAKRAQSIHDDESWVDNAVAPTLNAFDNTGESRSTVLILDGTRVNDVRVYDDIHLVECNSTMIV